MAESTELVVPVPIDAPEPPAHPEFGEPTERYLYHGSAGGLLCVRCRFATPDGGKTIRPLTLWREGGGRLLWRWKALPAPRPLYHLHEIVAHPTADVLVVEGERACDGARDLMNGVIVTTWPDGAKAVHLAEWGPLHGRHVTLWEDADEDGAKAADKVVAELRKVGAERIRRVKLPSSLPKGWDLADWTPEAGFDPLDLIEQAEEIVPELAGVCDPVTLVGKPVPERQWLVHERIPIPHVTGVYGATTTGKTLIEQQLQTCCAIGIPWLGLHTRRVRSVGIYCEDPQSELEIRQHRINEFYGCSMADLGDMRWVSRFGQDNTLAYFDRDGLIQLTDFYHDITAYARGFGAKLVVIDTVSDVFAGSEIVRQEARQFISVALGALARNIDGAVVLSIHPSRAGAREGYSGSTAWEATLRSCLHLKRPEAEEGEEIDDSLRILECTNLNYAARGEPIDLKWENGVFQVVNRKGGNFGTIERRGAEKAFLDALDEINEQGRHVSDYPTAANYAPKVMVTMPQCQGFKRRDLATAMNRLFSDHEIKVEQFGRPSAPSKRIVRRGCS